MDESVSCSIEQEGRDVEMREGRRHDDYPSARDPYARPHALPHTVNVSARASTACCGLCRLSLQHVFVISLRRSYQLLTKASLVSMPPLPPAHETARRVYVHA